MTDILSAAGAPTDTPAPFTPTTTTTQPTAPAPTQTPPVTGQTSQGQPPDPSKIAAATTAAPKLDPDAAVGIASTATTAQQAAANAQIAQRFNAAVEMSNLLGKKSVDFQANFWKKAPNSVQALLGAAGYNPPSAADVAPSGSGGGFWHDVVHGLDDVRHAGAKVAGYVSDATIKPLGGAFNAAMSPVNQLVRAAFKNSQQAGVNALRQGATSEFTTEALLHTLNPLDIMRDWDSVSNGTSSFQPEALIYVQKEMGITGQTLKLAKSMAGGAGLQAALASVPAKERGNAYALIVSNPKFMDAVKLLSDSHLGLGQMVFGGINANQLKKVFPKLNMGLTEAAAGAGQASTIVGGAAAVLGGDEGGITEAAGTLKGGLALGAAGAAGVESGLADVRGETGDQELTVAGVHPLSGLADSLADWYANPLFLGLNFRAGYNAARYSLTTLDAMGTARDVRAFYVNDSAGQRYADKIVQKVMTPWHDSDGKLGEGPNINALRGTFKMEGMSDTARDIYEAVKKGDSPQVAVGNALAKPQALINIFRGRMGMFFHDDTVFPHMTIAQSVMEDLRGVGVKALGGKRFDVGALSPRELATDAFGDQPTMDGMAAAEAEAQKLGPVARFSRRVANLVPTNNFLVFNDPMIAEQIRRVARFSLPEDRVEAAVNGFMAIPKDEVGLQRRFLMGVLGDMMQAAGVDQSDKGQEFMQRFLDGQGYSFGDNADYIDPHNPDGPPLSHAILSKQLANAIALPDFREMYKFAKKSWFMSALQMGLNNTTFDKFMSVFWKRAMLLRPAFAIRVAGEEVLNYMLRTSPKAYLEGRIAASLFDTANTTREMRINAVASSAENLLGDVKEINDSDIASLHHAMTSHIPEEVLKSVKTPDELRASIQGFSALDWARRIGLAVVPKDIMDGAYELAKRGVLDSAFSDYIDAITSHGNTYLGEIPGSNDTRNLIRLADGTPISFKNTGVIRSYTSEDAEVIPKWIYRMEGLAGSPEARAAARGWAKGGRDAQVQETEDYINGRQLRQDLADAQEDYHAAIASDAPSGVLDNRQRLVELAEKNVEERESWAKEFVPYRQTKDGRTVESGAATQDEATRDWANAVVDEVNHLTMTEEGQDFDDLGERIPVDGPQPIRLNPPDREREPYRAGELHVAESSEKTAYRDVAGNEVRLFRAENTTTLQNAKTRLAAPGRSWTPSYQDAVNRAGADGRVYQVDVPEDQLKSDYKFHGTGDRDEYINRIKEAQHAGTAGSGHEPALEGVFESPDITHGRQGTEGRDLLIDRVARGEVPSRQMLQRVDRIHIPDDILAPEQIANVDARGTIDKLAEKGMEQVVGRPLNWMSRQPIFTRNYAVALKQVKDMLAARGIEDVDGSLAHDVAMERAFNETIPYIHNPRVKSQMSVVGRNLMPFWFAQEQFYKRWSKLFATYPEAWYKLQLTMNGLKSVGFVSPDQYGEESFVYPGSQAVLSFLTKFPFFGSIPIGVSMTGEVNQLNPTLALGGAPWPSFGPIATIPMSLVAAIFPGTSNFVQDMLGPQAPQLDESDQWLVNMFQQLTPSFANRLYDWVSSPGGGTAGKTGTPGAGAENISSSIYMSTMISAAQQMEAQGYGLTAAQQKDSTLVDQYLDRLASWTKNMLLLRTMFGFLTPATPTFKFNDQGLGAQLDALLATMPYDDAIAAFLKANPNATADTVYESTTSGVPGTPNPGSGTYVPATTQAVNFINENIDFFTNYPQLAPWAIPTAASKGLFNATAYQEETGLDLRARRSLDSWYLETKYEEGANIYFPLETAVEAAELKNPSEKDSIQETWDKWATGFKSTHPTFASQLAEPTATNRRNDIVQQVTQAIKNDDMPKTEWSTQVKEMMYGFDQVKDYYDSTIGNTAYETQRKDNKDAFIAWGTAFAASHPDVSSFWNGVLMKQVPG